MNFYRSITYGNAMQIFCKGSVSNKDDFVKKFSEFDMPRQDLGCVNYAIFSNPKNVISVFYEWSNIDEFQTYYNTSSSLDAEFRKNIDCYPLNALDNWKESKFVKFSGDEIFEFSRQSVLHPEEFKNIFSAKYSPKVLERIGLKQYELFSDFRNSSTITLLAIWNSKEDYLQSDEKFYNMGTTTTLTAEGEIIFTDRYLLNLERNWQKYA